MLKLVPHIKKCCCDSETPISLFLKMAQDQPYAFLFESAEVHKISGRYSFIGFGALQLYVFEAGGRQNPLEVLKKALKNIQYESRNDLPSLQAGLVGYFSYETVRHFEKLDLPPQDTNIPEGMFFLPAKLLVFDHFEQTLTLIAYDEKTLQELVRAFETALKQPTPPSKFFANNKDKEFARRARSQSFMSPAQRGQYEELVVTAQKKVKAGEIFQIVLSQVFEEQTDQAPFDLYRKLRLRNPSPYMYYLQYPDFAIVGSSPETLVKVEHGEMILRPIAGTRRRGHNFQEDAELAEELLHDAKERAEHMMLVDLGRHDVGRVCEPGTVKVTSLMQVEKYSHVMHLVSEVRGKPLGGAGKARVGNKHFVRTGKDLFDIFQAAFPAGTLTGAPKIRAMEIIGQLEKRPRGIYGGAVGYFGLSGSMDFAIAIRTMLYQHGRVQVQAGAGIVYDSSPQQEDLECRNKAKGPLVTLQNKTPP